MRSKEAEETFVLTDKNNKLDEWQRDDALEHWKSGFSSFHTSPHAVDRTLVMRKVLPDVIWETF